MSEFEFTPEQPIDGDTVLHCGHLEKAKRLHWWKFQHEIYFRRPDDTVGTACWIASCEKCFRKSGGNGTQIEIRGDSVWNGDDPVVERPKHE